MNEDTVWSTGFLLLDGKGKARHLLAATSEKTEVSKDLGAAMYRTPATATRFEKQADKKLTDYFGQLAKFFHMKWEQPNNGLPKENERASVEARITIDGAGRVLDADITRESGNGPLDLSVRKLLKNVDSLPPPPEGVRRTFEIIFRLDDD